MNIGTDLKGPRATASPTPDTAPGESAAEVRQPIRDEQEGCGKCVYCDLGADELCRGHATPTLGEG
jgi:hypothetical protein